MNSKPNTVLTLRRNPFSLELWPEMGGSIASFRVETTRGSLDVLRPATRAASGSDDARELASFPLVPFSNRVEGGSFTFQGKTVTLTPNMLPHPHPLHGHGWRSAWSVGVQEQTSAELTFRYAGGEWPWAYSARQRFELVEGGLSHELSVKNESSSPMPAGLGYHPYFERTADTRLTANVKRVWLGDAEVIPKELVGVPAAWDLSAGHRVGDAELDNCFMDWDGKASIEWPSKGLRVRIEADPIFANFVVYVPKQFPFFCVEPVSNLNNAFKLMERGVADTNIVVLGPGEELRGTARFLVDVS